MTIDYFTELKGIKKKETVEMWIKKGLIPKASIEDDYIPDSARIPYTKARAKNAKSIYYSIISASNKHMHVMPQIYKISQGEFNHYILELEKANLISRRVEDEVEYYDITFVASQYEKKELTNLLETIIKAGTQGCTEAILSHAS